MLSVSLAAAMLLTAALIPLPPAYSEPVIHVIFGEKPGLVFFEVALWAIAAALFARFFVVDVFTPTFKIHSKGSILISGASSGIGLDATVAIAKMGPFTVFAGVRSEADKANVLAACDTEAGRRNIIPIILDVTKQESIDDALAKVSSWVSEHRDEPFVALVNNAGIAKGSVVELTPMASYRAGRLISYYCL